MTDIERLVAIEEIRNLVARRLRAMDEKRWADYEAMHAEDHVSDTYGGEPAVGAKANTARLAEVLAPLAMVLAIFALARLEKSITGRAPMPSTP